LATLGQTLKAWIIDWQTIASLAPDNVELLPGAPRFAGYIPQRFKVYGRTMAKAPTYYLRKVQRQIGSDVVNVLRKHDPSLAPASGVDPKLGQVQEFSTLAQLAQQQGVPLWEVQGGNPAHINQARAVFDEIAGQIVSTFTRGKSSKVRKG
jgi:hypothetical protein